MKYLNLGCGRIFHKDWINVDMAPKDREVIPMDISRKLKFMDNEMDVVYHSHVLEHIPKNDAPKFINECYRVLKPGGVIRIAVPNLEVIARNYLNALDQVSANSIPLNESIYDWTMIELYDQSVRTHSGGELIRYLHQKDLPNRDFLMSRSSDAIRILEGKDPKRDFHYIWKLFSGLRLEVKFYVLKQAIKHFMLTKLLPGGKYTELGLFRTGGEIHQWMYDRYSLSRLLTACGFNNTQIMSADSSQIKAWSSFGLDVRDGKAYKPDSLYMEASK